MATQKCIYCLEELEASAFDTDHVIPQAFGRFANNLTLTDCVCKGCNNYFGWNLELFLGRDSIEALRRIQYGLKPVEEVGDLPLDRLSFFIAKEGEWQGVRLQLRVRGGEWAVEAMPQVGLARKGGHGKIYLTEQALADPATAIPADWDPEAGINVVAPSEAAAERLVTLLGDRGITGQKRVDLAWAAAEEGRMLVEISFRIDPAIRRSVAKIAFNYMAYVAGVDFALHPDFNATRDYIRRGVVPTDPLVEVTQKPILRQELPRWRGTKGHLITLEWGELEQHVVGHVSLFNEITYMVTLARYFSGLWRDIRSGHKFDISKRRVKRLRYTRLAR